MSSAAIGITNNTKILDLDLRGETAVPYEITTSTTEQKTSSNTDKFVHLKLFINTNYSYIDTDNISIIVISYNSYNKVKVREETYSFYYKDLFFDKLIRFNTDSMLISFVFTPK